jgi:hypothetical protein
VSEDQSKRVSKVGAFDRRWAFCGEPKFSFNHDRRLFHVSKSSRFLKTFTAYFAIDPRLRVEQTGVPSAKGMQTPDCVRILIQNRHLQIILCFGTTCDWPESP